MKIINSIDSVSSPKHEQWKSQWRDQSELDGLSYISDVVYPEDALMFCKVLFPDLFFMSRVCFWKVDLLLRRTPVG